MLAEIQSDNAGLWWIQLATFPTCSQYEWTVWGRIPRGYRQPFPLVPPLWLTWWHSSHLQRRESCQATTESEFSAGLIPRLVWGYGWNVNCQTSARGDSLPLLPTMKLAFGLRMISSFSWHMKFTSTNLSITPTSASLCVYACKNSVCTL